MSAGSVLRVGDLTAEPGTRTTGVIDVDLGNSVAGFPVVLVNGANPGPTIAVEAGIHGSEYVGIEALRQTAMGLDPAKLTGSLIALLIASPLAFAQRSIYFNPADGQNPNRSFPGNPEGPPSERLAAWIAANVIEPADRFIDLHGGDMNESLVPFSFVTDTGDEEIDSVSHAMADAFGLDYVIKMPVPEKVDPKKQSSAQFGGLRGIPSVLAEAGGQGLRPAGDIETLADGLLRALAAGGLSDREPPASTITPRPLSGWNWPVTQHTGCWHPAVEIGQEVEAGELLGHVRDPFGEELEAIESPVAGIVLFMVTGLPVGAGNHVLGLGI